MRTLGRILLALALAVGARAAHAQAQPDAGAACDGGLCDTTNGSTCSVGSSDPSVPAAVALALVLGRRRR